MELTIILISFYLDWRLGFLSIVLHLITILIKQYIYKKIEKTIRINKKEIKI